MFIPAYLGRINKLTNFESAENELPENGYKGSFEYPVIYPVDTEYEWHEINVFVNTEEDKTNAFRAGMNRHIAKPIKLDELMSALTELLKEQTQAL